MQEIKAKPISYGGTRILSLVKYIVIHYTGNNNDTAKANGNYFAKNNTRKAGAHFFVDQYGTVVQSISLDRIAWSVGGFFTQKNGAGQYYQKCVNTNSVSIELCDIKSKEPSDKMIEATNELVKYIQSKCPNAKTIIRHWDVNGKACPLTMAGKDSKKWADFKKAITTGTTTAKASKPAVPIATVKKGSKGESVKRLQRCLNYIMGAGLTVDGIAGAKTVSAIKSFQRKYKLAVDGIAGPKTIAKIKEVL